MADSKITALTAITTVNPATYPLVIVDTSDTSMAGSGTTKKVTTNQLLGSGGTATLASATITGDLTVDTSTLKVDSANNRVGIGTASPSYDLEIAGAVRSSLAIRGNFAGGTDIAHLRFINANGSVVGDIYAQNTNGGASDSAYLSFNTVSSGTSAERYRIASDGVATWSNVGGVAGTAMTLNSTGLGVGTSSIVNAAAGRGNVTIGGSSSAILNLSIGAVDTGYVIHDGTSIYLVNRIAAGSLIFSTNSTERLRIDTSGNVGVGVTPSAWGANYKAFQIGAQSCLYNALGYITSLNTNAYENSSGQIVRIANGEGTRYVQAGGSHQWFYAANASAGTIGGFTQAMTLDASGNLLVGTTVSPSGTKIGSIAKLGKVNVEGTNTVTVSTSVVALARAFDTGGLFFISGYNTSGGTQGWWLVAARGGTVTTIASDNATGLTVAFTTPGSVLSMNTTSGTLSVSCISMTNQSV